MNQWNLDSIFNGREDYAIMPLMNKGMLYSNGLVYLQKVFKYYSHSTKEERKYAYSEPTELIFNLKEIPPTAKNYIGNYPAHYYENYYSDIYFSRCLNSKNELIYSFQADHNIHVYDQKGNVKKYNAASNYINEFNPINEEDVLNMELTKRYYAVEPKYAWIKYDQFRDQYVRLAIHRSPYTNEDGSLTTTIDRKKSLIILDSDFQIKTEMLLDNKSMWSLIDITKDGFLMSTLDSNGLKFGIYDANF